MGIIISVAGIILVVYLISTYNILVKSRNMVKEAWSGIDVQLGYRHNLIPNLCATVKGYAQHEKEIFEKVTEIRNQCMSAKSPSDKSSCENELTGTLKTLFAVAENYPDLKANQNFLELQSQLAKIEDNIQMARRYYNGTARDFNTTIAMFPNNLIASNLGFREVDFFELDSATERENPKVDFS
jgi:LemA protein